MKHEATYFRHLAEACLRLAGKMPGESDRAALLAKAARYHELALDPEDGPSPTDSQRVREE